MTVMPIISNTVVDNYVHILMKILYLFDFPPDTEVAEGNGTHWEEITTKEHGCDVTHCAHTSVLP